MYEHMFFRANEQYPEPGAFVDRSSELGAVFNGTTTEERVNYYLTLPADSLAGGMRFLAAALRHPLFLPGELAREKEVVLGEYDRQEASPYFVLDQAMGQKLWPGNWSRKNVIGDRQVIRNVTPDQMREIQRRYYIPNNSLLLVTGDVDPHEVFSLARTIYGDWARGPDPFVADPTPPRRRRPPRGLPSGPPDLRGWGPGAGPLRARSDPADPTTQRQPGRDRRGAGERRDDRDAVAGAECTG